MKLRALDKLYKIEMTFKEAEDFITSLQNLLKTVKKNNMCDGISIKVGELGLDMDNSSYTTQKNLVITVQSPR